MAKDVIETLKIVAKQNKLNIDFTNEHVTLKDIGIDSLALLNMIFKTEDILGVQLENAELIKIKNLGDLITAFKKAYANK